MRTAEGKECTYLLSTTWLESTSGGSQSTSLVFRAHWFCFSKFGITFNSLVILERSGNWKSFSGQCWWWWCYIYAPFNTQEPTSCPIFVEHLHIHFHLLPSFRMTTASVLRTKLVVVGDWAVGKTAVVQQFLNAGTAFPKNYSMTLGGEVGETSLSMLTICGAGGKQAGSHTGHLRRCRTFDPGLLWT